MYWDVLDILVYWDVLDVLVYWDVLGSISFYWVVVVCISLYVLIYWSKSRLCFSARVHV